MDAIFDQHAFEPTGSAIAALVHLMHKVTQMFHSGNNIFVLCLMIDFSKLFDTVYHVILIAKVTGFASLHIL